MAFLPMTVALIVTSQIASRLTGRVGAGVVLTAGMVLLALGMLGLSRVSADGELRGPTCSARRSSPPPAWAARSSR